MAKVANKQAQIAHHYEQILTLLGRSLKDDSVKDTPRRAAKAMLEMTTPVEFNMSVFQEDGDADGIIFQNGIWVGSLCEHHLLPFFGTACVAVLPADGRILGLSKFSRLVRYHAAGLNTQERITTAVGKALLNHKELRPQAVGVSLRCYHTCMSMRGVRDSSAVTTTQFLGGLCRSDPQVRQEFLSVIRHPTVF